MYKTILINLNKDIDRLDFMTKQLGDLNMPFERLEAVHGKEYMEKDGSEYDKEIYFKKTNRYLRPGDIGCALSHKRCYQKFLNDPEYKDTKYLLILEDDVELDKNFKNILENEIKKNEENYKWNYLQFNYPRIPNLQELFLRIFTRYKNQYKILKNSKNINSLIKRILYFFLAPIFSFFLDFRYYLLSYTRKNIHKLYIRNHYLTGTYLIDKKVAKKILEILKDTVYGADETIGTFLPKYRSRNMNFFIIIQ